MEDYFKSLWPFQNVRTFNFRLISRQINPYARIGGNSAAFPVALAPKRRLVVATFCCDNFSVKTQRHYRSSGGAGGGSGGSSYYRRALQAGRQATPRPGVLFVDTILESSWQSLGSLSSGDFGSNPG